MDEIKLPEKAAKILREIRKQHKVAFEPLTVRESLVRILQVTDLESLLQGKDPFKEVAEFPFWVKLWEASMVLADVIAALPPGPDPTLLELGAGLAAPGLVAAAKGYKVTLSDYDPKILNFQRVSAAASGLTGISHQILDWLAPPDLPRFQTIIGAEILFREEFFQPLLRVFAKLLAPEGVIYLAHDIRRKSLPKFLLQAEKDYEIAVSTRKLTSADETLTIVVNRLRPRRS